MSDHTWVFTHRTRSIVNSILDVQRLHNEIATTQDQWLKWFMVHKSVNTLVHHRSYAEVPLTFKKKMTKTILSTGVYKNNRFSSADQRTHPKCIQPECVPVKRNAFHLSSNGKQSHVERNEVSKGKSVKQECTELISFTFYSNF